VLVPSLAPSHAAGFSGTLRTTTPSPGLSTWQQTRSRRGQARAPSTLPLDQVGACVSQVAPAAAKHRDMHCMLCCVGCDKLTLFRHCQQVVRLGMGVLAVLGALFRLWMRQGDLKDLLHWLLQCHLPRLRSRLWDSQVGATQACQAQACWAGDSDYQHATEDLVGRAWCIRLLKPSLDCLCLKT